MEGDYLLRKVHDEFAKRMEDENTRQNKRIGALEDTVRQISALTVSVEKLAVNMESMLKEQGKQGERLATLEGRDGDKWRTVTSHILTAVVGAVICYILQHIGL